ncbi:MAG: hypothetical protein R2784_09830 [Saprospiraceae bacterium]
MSDLIGSLLQMLPTRKGCLKPLIQTFSFYKKDLPKILITEPGRQMGALFLELLKKEGFHIKENSMDITYRTIRTKVGIWELTWQ